MESGEEGEAEGFPTPQELWDRTFAVENAWRDSFAANPYPDKSGSWQIRFYQEIAVKRVLEAITSGRNRILLTLATGTGKTSIAFQIIWKLFQSRWNLSGEPSRRPRILFLADRNNLADQAFNDFTAFAAFEENALARIEPDDLRKKGRVPTKEAADDPEGPKARPTKTRIKLGDGKERSIQHMLVTSFWHPDGRPISSQQFIELLYGQLPEFVKDEAELRQLWS
nr:DEAD/DEAH box helicase family protein [Cyanobium sp. BA20m-p-22]